MYITTTHMITKSGARYTATLLRESYRLGDKVKNRTIANLSQCSPQTIEAMKLALKHKDDLTVLGSLGESLELRQGISVGAVATVLQIARQLGIERALGHTFQGRLAMWQVIARVIGQGSRLSAVRLAQRQAASEVLDLGRGFDENDLYDNLKWLCHRQVNIEEKLFRNQYDDRPPAMFLYDVTSSYLEGTCNELGTWGYNRDGKKGKQQIVVGLLCDEQGNPVATEVFTGNTQDPKTVASQVSKTAERFGCHQVTFVGDRGMIKKDQKDDLALAGFHYITALTKPQIRRLLKKGVFQMSLFDETLSELQVGTVRYILRRNPLRMEEMVNNREDKQLRIMSMVNTINIYLQEHPRAKVLSALSRIQARIHRLQIGSWLKVTADECQRRVNLSTDDDTLEEEAQLDGCYVITTDLPSEVAPMRMVHDRYKDLGRVETAFRTMKTGHLELRPIHVRTAESTRGHVFVTMLAYQIVRHLHGVWSAIDTTVEEGLSQLSELSTIDVVVDGKPTFCRIPKPQGRSAELLTAASVSLPTVLSPRRGPVVTRRKLVSRR
jgi:hypothetical protein